MKEEILFNDSLLEKPESFIFKLGSQFSSSAEMKSLLSQQKDELKVLTSGIPGEYGLVSEIIESPLLHM